MTSTIRLIAVVGLVASCSYGFASGQAPVGAPAGATGQCKDGTYSVAAAKVGACRGHQGVKDWYVAVAPPAGAKTASMPTPAESAAKATMPVPATTAQPPAMPAPVVVKEAPSMPAPTPVAAPVVVKGVAAATPATGDGPGMVWMNTGTKVYHCPSSQFYGKTKEGKYMSEADARAMGGRPNHNKPCVK
jgi:hypothetical protein